MFKKNSLARVMKITLVLLALVLMFTACSAPASTDDAGGEDNSQNGGTQVEQQDGREESNQSELPAPRVADCDEDNPYSVKCSSINADNLDEYLYRDDVLYIDLRDYADYAQKHLKNFEPIPYFGYIYNQEADTDDTKHHLYGGTTDDPVAIYEESDVILEAMIPKDKNIFFMCASGGRVAGMLQILEQKGYDMDKLYNVGGINQYTDLKFDEHISDTSELQLEATYSIEGLTRK